MSIPTHFLFTRLYNKLVLGSEFMLLSAASPKIFLRFVGRFVSKVKIVAVLLVYVFYPQENEQNTHNGLHQGYGDNNFIHVFLNFVSSGILW